MSAHAMRDTREDYEIAAKPASREAVIVDCRIPQSPAPRMGRVYGTLPGGKVVFPPQQTGQVAAAAPGSAQRAATE